MNIGFISDLHLDNNYNYVFENIKDCTIDFFERKNLDFLIISGDIFSDYKKTIKFVDVLNSKLSMKTYYVPGNHDVWTRKRNTIEVLETFKKHEYCVLNKVVKLTNDLYIIGGFPWYDFTLETEGRSKDFIEANKHMWVDHRFVDFRKKWKGFSNDQIVEMESLIKQTPENASIILCQHFVPHKRFILNKPHIPHWNDMNAFMGTIKTSKLANLYPNVKYVTFGHTHKRFGEVELDGVTYLSAPLGYAQSNEWETDSYSGELEKTLITLGLH